MIKKIRITGFKSIYDQTVELDPVTVLVGRSGSGKSAFVQAIRFLRNYLLDPNQAPQSEGGWERLLSAGLEIVALSIEVTFKVAAESDPYTYCIRFPGVEKKSLQQGLSFALIEEKLALGSQVLFHRKLNNNQWEWDVPPDMVNPPSPNRSAAIISELPGLEKVVYAYTALVSGIGFYNLPTSVWGLNRVLNQTPIPQSLEGLKDDASNHLSVIRSIVQDMQHPQVRKSIHASLRQLNPSVISIELNSITSPQEAFVGHTVGNKTLSLQLAQESDGFRRFYAHLLALYQLPPKLVNIFEEPENGIYPGAMSILADEFKSAQASGRGQVILTTHSPGLLDHFDVDSLRVVEVDKDGKTRIGKVAKEQRDGIRDNLLTTGELLTVDRARIDAGTPTEASSS